MLPETSNRRSRSVLLPLCVLGAGVVSFLWRPASRAYHIAAILLDAYLLAFLVRKKVTTKKIPEADIDTGSLPFFTLVVPCKNESGVICKTLQKLCFGLKYPVDSYRILVLDDHSTDGSFDRIHHWIRDTLRPLPVCQAIARPQHDIGGGKSGALNAALKYIFYEREQDVIISPKKRHIIGFLDADAQCDPRLLAALAAVFLSEDALVLQVLKKPIRWGSRSLLEDCQVADYMADWFVSSQRQIRRAGCASLRGNGMFFDEAVILHVADGRSALRGFFFNDQTTGDDVDMTCRLKIAGLKIHYIDDTYVMEELAPSWKALFQQRARWVYGGYRRYTDYLESLPCLWWNDPDELVEFCVLLAPIFLLPQFILSFWFNGNRAVWFHLAFLLVWGLGLMCQACASLRLALLGLIFSLHRIFFIYWTVVLCIWKPSECLPYWKTTRRVDMERGTP
jgi:cellulose synthase/poly-beta-1,6-N-acetylglucosamine synthase-like glycosyltransferase